MKNKHIFAIFYTTILIIATAWSLLDTFVIADKIAVVDETSANTSIYTDLENEYTTSISSNSALDENVSSVNSESIVDVDAANSSSDSISDEDVANSSLDSSLDSDSDSASSDDSDSVVPVITDYSYQDANIQITIDVIREYNTDIYVADVVVSDVAYLKTAFAQNTYGRNIKETTSEIADDHDAILAINGDYYGFRNSGFVIRNGVLYRTTAADRTSEALIVAADGNFEIVNESSSDAQTLYDEGALQAFSFGPALITDGEISVTSNSEVSKSKSSNPRTAIGMVDPLHYVFIVSDGRTSQSAGLSLLELAEIMQEYGCTEAYNLDGGGSSTMVFNGKVINNPTDGRSYGERRVSDIIYIGEYL
ncbi:MAG: phosphodiester glycosidase family protein [Ardenticatenaceae bacterium]|nr:phosphodiester glycosidase family protein [Ardenticatenaceae bacterium]